jgi:8-oxo-(d)GTP phosphatase
MPSDNPVRYVAAGGVVVERDLVLVLDRPSRDQIRLPKGHVEPGEDVEAAAVREVLEESGYTGVVQADLGDQIVEFDYADRHWIRTERYFLMTLAPAVDVADCEPQFAPRWVSWDEADRVLTFEPEREWLRRARVSHQGAG